MLSVDGPLDEGEALVRRGHNGAGSAMGVGASTRCLTANSGVDTRGDDMRARGEVGDIAAALRNSEAVGSIGRNHVAVLGPVDEGIARLGRGRQRGCLPVRVGASARNRTCVARVGGGFDDVLVQSEVANDLGITGDREGVGKVGRDLDAVDGPPDEVVALGGKGRHGAALAIVIGGLAIDGTALCRVGNDGDIVDVESEVGDVMGVLGDGNAESGTVRNHFSILGPVGEMIARVGSGREGADGIVMVGAGTSDDATIGRFGRGGNHAVVVVEVGHIAAIFGDGEAVGRACRNDNAILGPVDEVEADVGRGRQGAGGAVVIDASATDGAAIGRHSRCVDCEFVRDEVGHIVASLGDSEAVGRACRNLDAVLGPVEEEVVLVGGGDEGASLEVVVGAGAADRAAVGRVGRGGDVVAVEAEVGHIATRFGDGEAVVRA